MKKILPAYFSQPELSEAHYSRMQRVPSSEPESLVAHFINFVFCRAIVPHFFPSAVCHLTTESSEDLPNQLQFLVKATNLH